MAMTYEISGVPGLAVRIGHALESWGTRAARPVERDELVQRYEAQRAHEAALEARTQAFAGMYSVLR